MVISYRLHSQVEVKWKVHKLYKHGFKQELNWRWPQLNQARVDQRYCSLMLVIIVVHGQTDHFQGGTRCKKLQKHRSGWFTFRSQCEWNLKVVLGIITCLKPDESSLFFLRYKLQKEFVNSTEIFCKFYHLCKALTSKSLSAFVTPLSLFLWLIKGIEVEDM